ncbi:4'-phosphopantetheinyl transferase [Desulfatibacillum aliphaticivorans]|uniref:4'-phosphopantetheinyl transferase n=1 Tax=Desulfatibacillum aliphaticivorans TaxID=218208 RepID=B8FFP0_DESAL|nr:4'-phosphopantetheinyl transferase superfamily protein [Desulfatibacillum aliphaticivorans]ACL03445.1 4'-phosphopantetheinyl transferase [Desulfatibacillum aliphaticivorans]
MGIGNDIVDLLAPEAGNKHLDQRYAGRAFTTRELDAIQNSPKPGPLFWAIWACKEAAYKAFGQDYSGLSSWPKKYDVALRTDGDKGEGRVKTPGGEVFVLVEFCDRFVHAVAATDKDDLDRVNFGVAECKPDDGKSRTRSHAKHGNEKKFPSGLKSISVFAQEKRNAGLRNPSYGQPKGIVGWGEPRETQQGNSDNPPITQGPPQKNCRGRVPLPSIRHQCFQQPRTLDGANAPSPLTGEGRGGGDEEINRYGLKPPVAPSSPRTRGSSVLFASGHGNSFNEDAPPHPVLPPPGGKGRRPDGFGSDVPLRREIAPASHDDAAENAEGNGCAAQAVRTGMHSHAKHGNERPGGFFESGDCKNASALVRRLAVRHLSCLYNLDYSALQIVRKKQDGKLGPPLVQYGDQRLPVSLSLSHDGSYVAWAFLTNQNQRPCNTANPD